MKNNTALPIEAYIAVFDYLKHLSNLSTGCVLLMVLFIEKLFKNIEWKFCIAISLVSFFICVASSLVAQAATIEMIDKEESVHPKAEPICFVSMLTCWAAFFIGILFLVVFALKNLY